MTERSEGIGRQSGAERAASNLPGDFRQALAADRKV
jgi:hypothetical protein